VLAAIVFFGVEEKPVEVKPQTPNKSISVAVSDQGGKTAKITAYGRDCGSISIFADSVQIPSEQSGSSYTALYNYSEKTGRIAFTARSERGCSGAYSFQTPLQCNPGQTASCTTESGCDGARACVGGKFSPCVPTGSVCKPGARIGCMINSCQFGFQECNKCGTGYSKCSPADTLNYICNPGAVPK
jgi:hypothetical protein